MSTEICVQNYKFHGQVYSPAFSEPSSPLSSTTFEDFEDMSDPLTPMSTSSDSSSCDTSHSRKRSRSAEAFVSKRPKFANKYEEMLQPLSPVTTLPYEVRCQQPTHHEPQLQLQFESVIAAGEVSKIEDFLLHHSTSININQYNSEGRTALQQSCFEGNLLLAKVLTKYGADHRLTTRDGFSTLHIAAFSGHSDLLLYILSLRKVSS